MLHAAGRQCRVRVHVVGRKAGVGSHQGEALLGDIVRAAFRSDDQEPSQSGHVVQLPREATGRITYLLVIQRLALWHSS